MIPLTLDEIARLVGGTLHDAEPGSRVTGSVEYDSRAVTHGGLFVAFTPNGSTAFRSRKPGAWHKLWGLVHPQLLDDEFYSTLFRGQPGFVASSPYGDDRIREWRAADGEFRSFDLAGDELLCVVRKGL